MQVDFADFRGAVYKFEGRLKSGGKHGEVVGTAGGIDHQHVVVFTQAVDDEVVKGAAFGVKQKTVAATLGF